MRVDTRRLRLMLSGLAALQFVNIDSFVSAEGNDAGNATSLALPDYRSSQLGPVAVLGGIESADVQQMPTAYPSSMPIQSPPRRIVPVQFPPSPVPLPHVGGQSTPPVHHAETHGNPSPRPMNQPNVPYQPVAPISPAYAAPVADQVLNNEFVREIIRLKEQVAELKADMRVQETKFLAEQRLMEVQQKLSHRDMERSMQDAATANSELREQKQQIERRAEELTQRERELEKQLRKWEEEQANIRAEQEHQSASLKRELAEMRERNAQQERQIRELVERHEEMVRHHDRDREPKLELKDTKHLEENPSDQPANFDRHNEASDNGRSDDKLRSSFEAERRKLLMHIEQLEKRLNSVSKNDRDQKRADTSDERGEKKNQKSKEVNRDQRDKPESDSAAKKKDD